VSIVALIREYLEAPTIEIVELKIKRNRHAQTARERAARPAVTYKVRLAAEAREDLDRLYDFLLGRDTGAAERALAAIERAFSLLAYSPFSCRKALLQKRPRWRELLIPSGHSGYVALFEIDDDRTVTVTAVRHQREEDYH